MEIRFPLFFIAIFLAFAGQSNAGEYEREIQLKTAVPQSAFRLVVSRTFGSNPAEFVYGRVILKIISPGRPTKKYQVVSFQVKRPTEEAYADRILIEESENSYHVWDFVHSDEVKQAARDLLAEPASLLALFDESETHVVEAVHFTEEELAALEESPSQPLIPGIPPSLTPPGVEPKPAWTMAMYGVGVLAMKQVTGAQLDGFETVFLGIFGGIGHVAAEFIFLRRNPTFKKRNAFLHLLTATSVSFATTLALYGCFHNLLPASGAPHGS